MAVWFRDSNQWPGLCFCHVRMARTTKARPYKDDGFQAQGLYE